jgi:hypothetical protein
MKNKNTQLETSHVLKSFVNVAFTEKYKNQRKLQDEKDPIPARIDNIAVQ